MVEEGLFHERELTVHGLAKTADMNEMDRDERNRRLVLVSAIGITTAIVTYQQTQLRGRPSDAGQVFAAARFLLQGVNPYLSIGPGMAFDDYFHLYYPMPAIVVGVLFTPFPPAVADVLFMGVSSVLLALALTRGGTRNPQLLMFVSMAFLFAVDTVQWSPLIVAAGLTPPVGFLLACKPTSGLALFAAFPSRRTVIGAGTFGLMTVVLWPWWVRDWMATVATATHLRAPVTIFGGPLVLLALLRWRLPEARLLAGMACVPHTVALYEALPLFLVVKRWWEGATLVVLTTVVFYITRFAQTYSTLEEAFLWRARWQVWLIYLPCLIMVLRRVSVPVPDTAEMQSSMAGAHDGVAPP